MRLLGVDPSLKGCGFIIIDSTSSNKIIYSGRISTDKQKLLAVDRYQGIQFHIEKLIKKFEIEYVASEAVVFTDGDQGSFVPALYALYIVLQITFKKYKLPVFYILPKQWQNMLFRPKTYLWARDGGKTKKDKIAYDRLSDLEKEELDSQNLDWQVRGKQVIIERAKKETGLILSHDEADAYYIAKFGLKFWQFSKDSNITLTEEEENCFLQYKEPTLESILNKKNQGLWYKRNQSPGWFDFRYGKEQPFEKLLKINKAFKKREK